MSCVNTLLYTLNKQTEYKCRNVIVRCFLYICCQVSWAWTGVMCVELCRSVGLWEKQHVCVSLIVCWHLNQLFTSLHCTIRLDPSSHTAHKHTIYIQTHHVLYNRRFLSHNHSPKSNPHTDHIQINVIQSLRLVVCVCKSCVIVMSGL